MTPHRPSVQLPKTTMSRVRNPGHFALSHVYRSPSPGGWLPSVLDAGLAGHTQCVDTVTGDQSEQVDDLSTQSVVLGGCAPTP